MTKREWSLADYFAAVLAELNRAKDSYSTDDPLRYQISQMVRMADKSLCDGIQTATGILEAVKLLREQIKNGGPA